MPVAVVDLSGEAHAPQMLADTTSLTFGEVQLLETSIPQFISVSNLSGTGADLLVEVSSSSTEFEMTVTQLQISPNDTALVAVRFSPAFRGTRTGTLTFSASNDPDMPVAVVDLSGIGALAQLAVSQIPREVIFDQTTVHDTSDEQIITLQNSATLGDLNISLSVEPNQFVLTGASQLTIRPGDSSAFGLRFEPTTQGVVSGLLSITAQNGVDSTTVTVRLGGIGLSPSIQLGLETADYTLRFGPVRRIVGSLEQQVVLRNIGSERAEIFNVTTNNETFSAASPLNRTFVAGESASVSVTFAPQSTGLHEGALTITGDFGQPSEIDTIRVHLSGEGTSPEISTTPDVVDFGSETLNIRSLPRRIYVQNVGSEDLDVNWAASDASSPFQFSAGGMMLEPKESTQIDVTFRPTATDEASDSVVVTSNDPANFSTAVIFLGTGQDTQIDVTGVDFGDVLVGEASQARLAVITNLDANPVEVTIPPLTGGGFDVERSVVTIAENGGTQSVPVIFTPIGEGSFSANLQIEDETGQFHAIPITGRGVVPEISLASGLSFPLPVRVSESDTIALPISNDGAYELSISGIRLVDESGSTEPTFLLLTAPPLTMERAGGRDTVLVEFRPRDIGSFTGTVTIEHNDPNREAVPVTIAGTGKRPLLEGIPTVEFGEVRRDGLARSGDSRTLEVRLFNSGTDTLYVTETSVDDSEQFTVPSINIEVPPDQERFLPVSFHPTRSERLAATVSIQTARPPATATFSLSGTGIHPEISATPRVVLFDTTTVNLPGTENPKADFAQLIIKNDGRDVATITDLVLEETDQFQIIDTQIENVTRSAPWTLEPGGLLVVQLQFEPTRADLQDIEETEISFATNLTIHSDDADSTLKVANLFGIGVVSSVRALAGSIDFGRVAVGATSRQTLRLRNDGDETRLEATWGDPQFDLVGGATVVVPNGSQDIELAFTPTSRNSNATIEGVMTFADLGTSRKFDVELIGEGVQGAIQIEDRLIQFGSVRVAVPLQETVSVANVGNSDLVIEVSVQADTPDEARHYRPEIETTTITPGAIAFVPVTFTPARRTSEGNPFRAQLRVKGIDALQGTELDLIDVSLTGVGVAPQASTQDVSFGRVAYGGTGSAQLTIGNTGSDTLSIYGIEVINSALRGRFTFENFATSTFEIRPNSQRAVAITLTADNPFLLDLSSLDLSIFHESSERPDSTATTGAVMTFEIEDGQSPEIGFSNTFIASAGPSAAVENEALQFIVFFRDNTGRIDQAATNLRSRKIGGTGAYEIDRFTLTQTAGVYRGAVELTPEDASRGLEYYIETADSEGNTSILDRNGLLEDTDAKISPFPLRVAVRELQGVEVEPVNKTYRMVSVPLDLNNGDVFRVLARTLTGEDEQVIKADATKWRLFQDGGEELKPGTSTAQFTPGRAFWVVVKERPINMRAAAGISTAAIPAWDTTLVSAGWHMLGHPYNFPVAWSAVEVDGASMSNGRASTASFWEHGSEYGFGKGDWGVDSQGLRPWHGYAVHTTGRNTDLTIHPRTTARTIKLAGKWLSDSDGWITRLLLTSRTAIDRLNLFGMTADASEEWDPYDNVEPPAIGDYAKVYFLPVDASVFPVRQLSADIRPPGEGATWHVQVESNLDGELLHLSLPDPGDVPKTMDVALYDLDSGVRFDLQDREVSFRARRERRFRLIVGSPQYITGVIGELTPVTSGLGVAFPNPFNAEIGITYRLASPGLVRVEIYNIAGQRVRVLVDDVAIPGYHRIAWDGRDRSGHQVASGAYVVKMVTPGATKALKILLLR
jgi:hypothetical protein